MCDANALRYRKNDATGQVTLENMLSSALSG